MKRLIAITGVLAIAVSACADNRQNGMPGNAFTSSAAKPGNAPAATPVSTTGNSPSSAPADTPSASANSVTYRDVTLPAGTVLPVDLETSVGSDISRVEQRVDGRLRRAVTSNGVEVLPAGTAVIGHVTTAERPGRVKGRGLIAFRFTEIDTPGAGTTRMSTGTISRQAPGTKKKDAAKIGVPAGAGAIIGGIVGGGDGAAKGAVIGGAAGTGYVLSTRGQEVRLGKGADLAVKLTAPLTVRVQER